jgi:Uncharacterized protein conserved in bacteria (DUF2188)
MAQRQIKVKPTSKGWQVIRGGSGSTSGHYRTKAEAERAARRMARNENSMLIVYSRAGKFTGKSSSDPRPPKHRTHNGNVNERQHASTLELSPKEKARLWREWTSSHSKDSGYLSEESISRDAIYGDRG